VIAGVVSQLGYTRLPAVAVLGTLGLLAADTFWFCVGRWRSEWVRGTRLYCRAETTIRQVATRLGPRQIVLSRFVYGTRVPTMFFWGVLGLSFRRFVAMDLIGCGLWATLLTGAGYAMSGSAQLVVGRMEKVEVWILCLLIAAALLFALLRLLLRKRRSRGAPLPSSPS
jgi:membrane protein DedA with SNARE-associated domain